MANLYVLNIKMFGMSFDKVPWLWADEVKQKLIDEGLGHLVPADEVVEDEEEPAE